MRQALLDSEPRHQKKARPASENELRPHPDQDLEADEGHEHRGLLVGGKGHPGPSPARSDLKTAEADSAWDGMS